MGMFDSFYLTAKCPYCGEKKVREFQTKLFLNLLNVWKEEKRFICEGIKIKEGIIEDVCTRCYSQKCGKTQKLGDLDCFKSGKLFYCDVKIQNYKVVGAINIKKK